MWIPSLPALLHILIVGSLSYAFVVISLRITGVRALAKLNAFDFAVTVAIGSTLATAVVSKDLSLVGAMLAITLLLVLQWLMAQAIRRSETVRRIVTARPILVVRNGQVLPENMRKARLSNADVQQSIRASGLGGLEQVGAMLLETDGSVSVIPADKLGSTSALADIADWQVESLPTHNNQNHNG